MKSKHLYLAALIAVLLQPLVGMTTFFPIWIGAMPSLDVFLFYSMAVLIVSGLVVFLLGIPCFSILHKTQKLGFVSISVSGIFLAMLPYLLIGRPQYLDGYTAVGQWHGQALKFYENGQPMALAWLNYAEVALGFGIHGLLGGLVFYAFWRKYKVPAFSI